MNIDISNREPVWLAFSGTCVVVALYSDLWWFELASLWMAKVYWDWSYEL